MHARGHEPGQEPGPSLVAALVREVMNDHPPCGSATDTVREAACRMRDLSVDSLPVCDEAGRLTAVLTEHDIVVRSVAEGHDPTRTRVGSLVAGPPLAVGVRASLEEALARMIEHAVRRLPVVDDGRLVGIVSQAALASRLPPATVRRLVAPPSPD